MGKGEIKSGGTAGQYTIDIVRDVAAVLEQARALAAQIEDLEQQITAADLLTSKAKTKLVESQAKLNSLLAAYQDLITNPQQCVQCSEKECVQCEAPSCTQCPSGNWRIGAQPCRYSTLSECQDALPSEVWKFGETGSCSYGSLAACQAANPNWKYGEFGDCLYQTQKACQDANDPKARMQEITAHAAEVAKTAQVWRTAKRTADRLKLIKTGKEKLKDELDAVEEKIEETAWCADYTEDLTGEVATAEVPGQRTDLLIRPGFDGRADYSTSRDGILVPSQGSSKEAVAWNWAMRPGWQKWAPTYRGAVIDAINGSLCDITLDDARSTDNNLYVNDTTQFTDVPIEYMDCNGAVFEVDDHVLVEFVAQDRTNPKVIGFWDNPKPCTTGYFVCVPVATEAPTGWGDPFWTAAVPPVAINPPLGTAGGTYSESVIKGSSQQNYVHRRKGDDYGGEFTQQLLRTYAYGFYDWHGDALGDTLSINSTDGNRYWGFGAIRDTEIFYRGVTHCNAYNSQKVIGVARAEFSGTEYLYAVFLKPDGADPIDETFEVWRRVWQETAYANDNLYNASTEPLGWESLGDVSPPLYSSYVPASTGVPRMDYVSATDSGQIGGAAFSPDGKYFLLTYRLIDVGGSGAQFDMWVAGYMEVTISGASGDIITPVMSWNPIIQNLGWDYIIAADYDKSGNLVELFWEEESNTGGPGSFDIRNSLYIIGGSYAVNFADHCPYSVSGRGYTAYYYAFDLRTASAVGQYYAYTDKTPDPDEEFGEIIIEGGAVTRTPLVTRGATVSLIAADGSFSGGTGYYALSYVPWTLPFWGDRGFNGAAWDYHGNMLSSYNCHWAQIESHFAVGPGAPTSNGYRNRLTGEGDVDQFLSIDGYTNPALLYLGVL